MRVRTYTETTATDGEEESDDQGPFARRHVSRTHHDASGHAKRLTGAETATDGEEDSDAGVLARPRSRTVAAPVGVAAVGGRNGSGGVDISSVAATMAARTRTAHSLPAGAPAPGRAADSEAASRLLSAPSTPLRRAAKRFESPGRFKSPRGTPRGGVSGTPRGAFLSPHVGGGGSSGVGGSGALGSPPLSGRSGRSRGAGKRIRVCRVADGADTNAIEVREDRKVRQFFPMDDVVGIRFDIFYEGQLKRSYGQILLVRRSGGLKLEQWKSWIWLIMHTFVLWLVLSQLTGPIAAAALLAALGPAVYNHEAASRRETTPSPPPQAGAESEVDGGGKEAPRSGGGGVTSDGGDGVTSDGGGGGGLVDGAASDSASAAADNDDDAAAAAAADGNRAANEAPGTYINTVSLVSICGFLWIVCTWVVPRLAGGINTTFGKIATTIACIAAFALVHHRHEELIDRFGLKMVDAMPALQKPEVIRFKQHEIGAMLEAREHIMSRPDDKAFYGRVRNLSVGSFWVETVMSSLTPRQIYNGIHWRRGLHYFLNFVMPVLFALQIFGVIRPQLSRFKIVLVTSLQQDWLLRGLRILFDRFMFTGDFLYLRWVLENAMLWTSSFLERVAQVVQAAEYTRLKLKRLGESTQVLTLLGQVFWDVFAQVGEVLVLIATLLSRVITETPLRYGMTAINGMMKTDRFAHVLSANERFWRYMKNTRRFFGFEGEEVVTGGEPPPPDDDHTEPRTSIASSPELTDDEDDDSYYLHRLDESALDASALALLAQRGAESPTAADDVNGNGRHGDVYDDVEAMAPQPPLVAVGGPGSAATL